MSDLNSAINLQSIERNLSNDTEPLLFRLITTDPNTPQNQLKSNIIDIDANNTTIPNNINKGMLMLMCRICHCEENSPEFLITPCYCTGTLKYVHQACLQQWLKSNGMKSCELCKFEFIMETRTRSFRDWEKLDMNHIERRKILCSVTFHLIAISCVIWSLYILIQKTVEEISQNRYDWSFWTKLVVVAIGFTGGVVFMYIQCKMYFQLCNRWRQYNRMIIIQPITDEILKCSKQKQLEKMIMLQFSSSNNNNNNNTVVTAMSPEDKICKSTSIILINPIDESIAASQG